jgi:hypothetical protein
MAVKDGGSGNATIDISALEKGGSEGLADKLKDLDFGDDVVDEVVEEDKVEKKTEKKAPKKAEKKETPAEEEESEEEESEEEESEEESEEDDDTALDDKKTEEPVKKEVKMVPQARLMHVKAKVAGLEEQLRAAQDQIAEAKRTSGNAKKAEEYEEKIDSMYTELETLRAAGDVAGAAKAARALDKIKEEATQRQSSAIAAIEARNLLEQRLYDTVVTQLELVAPQVNPDSDDFDQDLVTALDAMTRGYESRGVSPSDALKAAATRLLGKDVFTDKSIRREKQPEPKKVDVKKNADAVKKTPPSAIKEERTEKSQELKASALSRDEFAKLPQATQRRLLGDEL